MANICTVYVTITGDKSNLDELYDMIRRQSPILIRRHPMLRDTEANRIEFGLHNHQRNENDLENSIVLSQSCRWKPRIEDYIDLSEDYPTLTIEVGYEEAGNDVYGGFTVTGGSCIESHKFTEEQWLEQHDEDYQAEKKRIAELPYEEFLEEYTEWDVSEENQYAYLGKDIIARIKDEDLPLFVNVDWMDETVDRMYKNRYSA